MSNLSANSVSVVIPLFNEEKRISATLRRISEYQNKSKLIKELILVDDKSADNTLEVLNNFQNFSVPIKILKNKKNMGKGFSVKKGIEATTGDAVLFMDADNSVDISYLEEFIQYLDEADVVIASIEVFGHKIIKDDNHSLRRLLGRLSKKLINIMVGGKVHDTQRGFKLFSKKSARIIFPKQTIFRWGFDIEILLIARRLGFNIKEVPVVWNNPKSTSVNFLSYLSTLTELFYIKWNDILGKYK